MSLDLWLVYLVAACGLSLTPGPNGLLALTHGVRFGVRKTIPTVLGGILGFVILVALSFSGLGALLAASERAFMMLKWFGAAYLIYLGVRLWFAPPPLNGLMTPVIDQNSAVGRSSIGPSAKARFREGLLVALSNPKALLFFAAFLPQFIAPDKALWSQFLVLGGTFAAVELTFEMLVAAMAGRLARWLGQHGKTFNRLVGTCFVAIGGLLAQVER